jgi:hypothetical protein
MEQFHPRIASLSFAGADASSRAAPVRQAHAEGTRHREFIAGLDADSVLHRCPRQPRALGGADEVPIRLVGLNAKLVLPPAIPSEDHLPLRQVPYHLAHIEDEKLLGEVFSRP